MSYIELEPYYVNILYLFLTVKHIHTHIDLIIHNTYKLKNHRSVKSVSNESETTTMDTASFRQIYEEHRAKTIIRINSRKIQ